MHVIATAGHVDHGKSTLIQALTGTDPDRWAEEKARGLTIDLGFAFTTLPSGAEISFIDVPGHVRFLKNMLAGVGGVDACLFVVAATEAWKPQSEEHLRILQLLGITHGIVALTKVALVDDDLRELAQIEIEEHAAGTFLEGAEIVAVDAPSGRGLDELQAGLERLVQRTPTAADRDQPRLWVDRSFAAKGAGTVVTGTLTGGTVSVDDELALYPGDRRVRVRSLQTAHARRDQIGPGHRVALNLTGVHHDQVARGHALVRPTQWHAARTADATLTVLPALDHAVSRRGAYVAYVGSGEHAVRVRVLGPDAIEAGSSGLVRLHLPVALPLIPGDRFVLRESGRQETIGGGEILDVDPRLPASRARPDRSVDRVIRERGWTTPDELERLTGERRVPTIGRWLVDPAVLEERLLDIERQVKASGGTGVDLAARDERERALFDQLATDGTIIIERGRARVVTAADRLAGHPYVVAVDASPFAPPTPSEFGLDAGEKRDLIVHQLLIEDDGVCFTPAALDAACQRIAELLEQHPDGATVADIRDALGTSRKYVIPLLAILDRTGRTRRRDDRRVAGPRLLPRP